MPNPYANKIIYGGQVLIDLTSDTVQPSDVAQGKTFHDKSGAPQVGTSSGGGGGTPYAIISVTYPSGSVCTCTKGSTVLTAEDTSGKFNFGVPEAGEWTLYCTDGSDEASKAIMINNKFDIISVELNYKPMAYTTPTAGVSYNTDISGITTDKMKLYSEAISNNSTITHTTPDVYIDDGATHIKMSVGASKTMTIDGSSYEFIIIGFNHDDLTISTYYGDATATGKAGITWQTRNSINERKTMNSTDTNIGGWTSCVMRTSTIATLFNGFGFKDAVAPVNKLTSKGNASSIINTDSDTFFLLSRVEVYGDNITSYSGEGKQYAWYAAGNNKKKTVNGSAAAWWQRSPASGVNNRFCAADSSGGANTYNATTSVGAAPAFCT